MSSVFFHDFGNEANLLQVREIRALTESSACIFPYIGENHNYILFYQFSVEYKKKLEVSSFFVNQEKEGVYTSLNM